MVFEYTLRLPPGLSGELVLLQWYYLASNSRCVHEGYAEYDFPREWIKSLDSEGEGDGEPSAWEEKFSVGTGLKSCDEVLSEDAVSSFVNGLYCLVKFLMHVFEAHTITITFLHSLDECSYLKSSLQSTNRTLFQDGIPEQFWNCAEISIAPRLLLRSLLLYSSSTADTEQYTFKNNHWILRIAAMV